MTQTPRDRFIAALERRPLTGRVPHFELVFFLTMEAFGKVHPSHCNYEQWLQMEESERGLHWHDMADLYIATAERYGHSAIFLHPNPDNSEFVTPFLAQLTAGMRDLGFYVIKHTDGNITPINDQLVQTNPHALHSLDPQGGVDITEVKRLYGDQVCLIGNVNCGLMDTGTDQEVSDSVRYALQNGMPGGSYIFSTSNCIYAGMPLAHYESMLDNGLKKECTIM